MRLLVCLALSVGMVSCGAASAGPAGEQTEKVTAPSTYYGLRPDLRLCLWPSCGGVLYHAVNRDKTVCADDAGRSECYAAALELGPLEMTRSEQTSLLDQLSQVVVLGTIEHRTTPSLETPYFALRVESAWRPAGRGTAAPGATSFRVSQHGDVTQAQALNQDEPVVIDAFTLEGAGLSDAEIAAAKAALATGDLVVQGRLEGHRLVVQVVLLPARGSLVIQAPQTDKRL